MGHRVFFQPTHHCRYTPQITVCLLNPRIKTSFPHSEIDWDSPFEFKNWRINPEIWCWESATFSMKWLAILKILTLCSNPPIYPLYNVTWQDDDDMLNTNHAHDDRHLPRHGRVFTENAPVCSIVQNFQKVWKHWPTWSNVDHQHLESGSTRLTSQCRAPARCNLAVCQAARSETMETSWLPFQNMSRWTNW